MLKPRDSKSVTGKKKAISFMLVIMLAGSMLTILPQTSQVARGYMTPGIGMTMTFEDLVLMSGGAVTGGMGMYQVHETITIMPSDTLMVTFGLIINIDPGMNIAIEIMGNLDGMMGVGTLIMGAGPGSWRGIWVHGSGGLNANGFTIMDAQDGIYIDHSMGFGMVQITGCQILGSVNTGITMLGTMGGPMVQGNTIISSPIGLHLVGTTAQCQMNEVWNCGIGFRVEGNPGPGIFGNNIHDNSQNAVYVESASTWLSRNIIRDNQGDAVVLFNSTASLDSNDIFAWNATADSGSPGSNGVLIDGSSIEWGQNWFSNNTIIGGNGDGSGNGGHAILLREFVTNMTNGWVENTIIENNPYIRGGTGGINIIDGMMAGDGGCGIYVEQLPDDGNWLSDNQGIIVSGNLGIRGGYGGENLASIDGFSGRGGDGIRINDMNNLGNIRISNNVVIGGGGGGLNVASDSGIGNWGIGWAGHGIFMRNISEQGNIIKNNSVLIGGKSCDTEFALSGAGINILDSSNIMIQNNSGHSMRFLVNQTNTSNVCINELRTDDVNSGGLVRAEGCTNSLNNENWILDRMNFQIGISIFNCSNFNIRNVTLKIIESTSMLIQNSDNISLDDINVNITDGIGIDLVNCTNITLSNATLNGTRASAVPEKSVVRINGGDIITVGPASIAYGNSKFAVADMDTPEVTIIDAENVTVKNTQVVGTNCAGIAFSNNKFALFQNNVFYITNGTGVNIANCTDLNLDSLELFGNGSAMSCDAIVAYRWDRGNVTFVNASGFSGSGLNFTRCSNLTTRGYGWTNNRPDPGVKPKPGIMSTLNRDLKYDGVKVNMTNGTGLKLNITIRTEVRSSQFHVANGTGIAIENCQQLELAELNLDGTNSVDPNEGCGDSIKAYNWTLGNIRGCTIEDFNGTGVNISQSSDINITENRVANNEYGFRLTDSNSNYVYHNNFLGNVIQASDDTGTNTWHNGYPSGGNYWSDYVGPDLMNGPLQNIPGPDNIGDFPYLNIQGGTGTVDQYPLIVPWTPPPLQFFNITLNIGWNLISLPLEMADISTANVLSSISGKYDSVKYYDSLDASDPWKTLRPGFSNDLAQIDNTMGIWVDATQVCTLKVSGTIPTSTAITLHAGWNLVGYPSLAPRAAGDAILGTGYDRLECYDPASPYIRVMNPLEMMTPGQGYWIHVPADTVWTINW